MGGGTTITHYKHLAFPWHQCTLGIRSHAIATVVATTQLQPHDLPPPHPMCPVYCPMPILNNVIIKHEVKTKLTVCPMTCAVNLYSESGGGPGGWWWVGQAYGWGLY